MRGAVSFFATVFLASSLYVGCFGQPPAGQQGDRETEVRSPGSSFSELVQTAQSSFAQGDYAKAEELAIAAFAQQPNNGRLHMMIADIRFIAGNIEGAIESYDKVIEIQPESKPFLWQRGLALYYANDFKKGMAQFESHQSVNSQDVENAVWHLLCAAKVENLEIAREKLIPIERDNRVPMKEIYELFAGRLKPEQVIEVAQKEPDNKLPLYFANLYIGLYYEMLGQREFEKKFIHSAVNQSVGSKNNLMAQLARIHQELRGESTAQTPLDKKTGKGQSSEGGTASKK